MVVKGLSNWKHFNAVWKSSDQIEWTQVTEMSPWAPLAGAAVIVLDDYLLYMLGVKVAFIGFHPPYINKVWKIENGIELDFVMEEAGWSP